MDKLLITLDAQALVLFGSRATGTHRPDSDYDIALVLSPGRKSKDQDHVTVHRVLKRVVDSNNIDLVVVEAWFWSHFARRRRIMKHRVLAGHVEIGPAGENDEQGEEAQAPSRC